MKIKMIFLLVLLFPYFSCMQTSVLLSDSIVPDEIGTLNKDYNKEARELTIEPITMELTFDGDHYLLPTEPGNKICLSKLTFEQSAGYYELDYVASHMYSKNYLKILGSFMSNDIIIKFYFEKYETRDRYHCVDSFSISRGGNIYKYDTGPQELLQSDIDYQSTAYLMDIGLDFKEGPRDIRIVWRGNLYKEPIFEDEELYQYWFDPAVIPLEQEAFPFEMILRVN